MKSFDISNFEVGGENCFIIAELSANHNGNIEIAIKTIEAAKKAGADAIKLQTYTPDTITIDCDNDYFKLKHGTLWDGKTLYELYGEAYTPWEWHEQLFKAARENKLICFSSPFDHTAVDFLEQLDTPAYKIASFEISDVPLIKYAASKGKPIIISTGIADTFDIDLAVETCKKVGNHNIALLKCTSSYPAPIEDANLLTIADLSKKYGVVAGLSDHTMGIVAPVVAVSLGAKIIEKHFILDRTIGGPDADFSLDFGEFKEMVDSVRNAEKALGGVSYKISEKVQKSKQAIGRSLFVVEDIEEGEIFTEKNIRSIRPGYGLHPKFYEEVLGKKAKSYISRGTPLNPNLFE